MKRALGLLAATTLLASGAVALGTGSVGAAATTTPVVPIVQTLGLPLDTVYPAQAIVFVVHGLNLDGQDAQTDGGTPVTVCAGGATLLPDLQFGDIAGPKQATGLQIAPGAEVDLTVFLGSDADCAGTDPVISQTVTVPDTPVVALVATAGPGGLPELLPVVIDIDPPATCLQPVLSGSRPQGDLPDSAKLGAVHAAGANPVVLTVDGDPAPSGPLSFGDSIFADGPPGPAEVAVTLDGTLIVGPVELVFGDCELTVVYVVGNQPTGEEPATTTTAPAPAAQAVTAKPAFTG